MDPDELHLHKAQERKEENERIRKKVSLHNLLNQQLGTKAGRWYSLLATPSSIRPQLPGSKPPHDSNEQRVGRVLEMRDL